MPNALGEIAAEFRQMLAVVTLILALLQVFFGYRMLKFWISLAGFLAGLMIGVAVAGNFLAGKSWAPIVLGLAFGVGLGFLAFKVYLAGVFLYCGLIAARAVLILPFPDGNGWSTFRTILCILAFLAAGILAVRFSRPVIIVLTAVTGSISAIQSWGTAWPKMAPSGSVEGAVLLLLVLFGLTIQFLMSRGDAPVRRKSRTRK